MKFEIKNFDPNGIPMITSIYDRIKEEVFYRRYRTSFITTRVTGVFIALIIGKLSGNIITYNAEISFLIILIILMASLYYWCNSTRHRIASNKQLFELEKNIEIEGKSLRNLCMESSDTDSIRRLHSPE